jgi:hypothetical protein
MSDKTAAERIADRIYPISGVWKDLLVADIQRAIDEAVAATKRDSWMIGLCEKIIEGSQLCLDSPDWILPENLCNLIRIESECFTGANEPAPERGPVIDATCRRCAYYDAYEGESCENSDRSCVGHSLFVAQESAPDAPPEPDTRGPEVGDIVAWHGSRGQTIVGVFGKEITQGDAIVLMRRAEVEARMGGQG